MALEAEKPKYRANPQPYVRYPLTVSEPYFRIVQHFVI